MLVSELCLHWLHQERERERTECLGCISVEMPLLMPRHTKPCRPQSGQMHGRDGQRERHSRTVYHIRISLCVARVHLFPLSSVFIRAGLPTHEAASDDHSEAEAILHKLDKVARQRLDRKGSFSSSSGAGGGGGGGGTSAAMAAATAAAAGSGSSSNGGAVVTAAGVTAEASTAADHSKHGGVGDGAGESYRKLPSLSDQHSSCSKKEAEEEDTGERHSWYYGGRGWGRAKSDAGGKEKEKEKEKEKKEDGRKKMRHGRSSSWLGSISRMSSTEQLSQPPQSQQKPPHVPDESRGGSGDGGGHGTGPDGPDGNEAESGAGNAPTGGSSSSNDAREPEGEGQQMQDQNQQQQVDKAGHAQGPGGDEDGRPHEDGQEEEEGAAEVQEREDGQEEEEEEEGTLEEQDGDGDDGDGDHECTDGEDEDEDECDIDDDDEDDDEEFESDDMRHAQARLASDSYLSMRCDSEFFAGSVSSTTRDEDEEVNDLVRLV